MKMVGDRQRNRVSSHFGRVSRCIVKSFMGMLQHPGSPWGGPARGSAEVSILEKTFLEIRSFCHHIDQVQ